MNAKRAFTIVLSTLLVIVMLFSFLFLIAEADHDCSGEDCRICRIIAIVEEVLKSFSLLVCLALLSFASHNIVKKVFCYFNQPFFRFTPVSFKVKLSN